MQIVILSIILAFSLVGCKTAAPQFPKNIRSVLDVRFEEKMDVEGNPILIAHCFSIEIISKDPFKLGDIIELNPMACEGLMGFNVKEMNQVFKWGDDLNDWIETSCKNK